MSGGLYLWARHQVTTLRAENTRLESERDVANNKLIGCAVKIAELEKATHEVDQACIAWGLYFDITNPKESLASLLRMTVIGATDPDISREAAVNNLEQQAKGVYESICFCNFEGVRTDEQPNRHISHLLNSRVKQLRKEAKELKE